IEPLERMAEEGITARFHQLIMDSVNPLKEALSALGGGGSTTTSAARPAEGGVGTVVRPSVGGGGSASGGTPTITRVGSSSGRESQQTILVNVGNEQLERVVRRGLRRTVRVPAG